MNEDQYWVIVGTMIGLFASVGIFMVIRIMRKDSQEAGEE